MQLVGKERLLRLKGISTEIDIWVAAWATELTNAVWISDKDVLENFPKARRTTENNYEFPVCKSPYRLKVALCFPRNLALICEVKESE